MGLSLVFLSVGQYAPARCQCRGAATGCSIGVHGGDPLRPGSHAPVSGDRRIGASGKRGELGLKVCRSPHRLCYGAADHRKLVLLGLGVGPQIR